MAGTRGKGKGAAKNTKEALKPVDDRKVGKRKAAVAKSSQGKAKKEMKVKKDPNKPKRPPSAFFVFLEEFRSTFKKENPNVKAVSAVGKAAGEKWKSMPEDEKSEYEAKAAKRKTEYEKQMNDYNKKQEEQHQPEDEEEDQEDEEEEDDDDDGDDDDDA
ncbi:hypothetical protein SLEP1_g31883 [Rubroshorea leprosula]|uniref:HMG box domain-containing protein n=1 Tax=Rubroshorea leprosula TaxID=152421 RepID=A0AAV5KBL9_9ROSI|nr:hypothetical protein SLEP1_g31883 [Rubroshorea leprosula]